MLACFKVKSGKSESIVFVEVSEIRYTPDYNKDTVTVRIEPKDSAFKYEGVFPSSSDLAGLKKATISCLTSTGVCDFTGVPQSVGRSNAELVFKAVAS